MVRTSLGALVLAALAGCGTPDPGFGATGDPARGTCTAQYDDGVHAYTAACGDDAGTCACTMDGADAGVCQNVTGCAAAASGATPTTCCVGLQSPHPLPK
jgi:hypothetical protein